MKFDPQIHHRHSIRLKGYDYSLAGAYFITIVTQNRMCLFGEIENASLQLNIAGVMVEKWWLELEQKYPSITSGTYIIMPNHFHGIVLLNDPTNVGVDLRVDPGTVGGPPPQGGHAGPPLPAVVQWFKTMTTNEYIRGVKQLAWRPFEGKLWQRNYYERIIRNEDEYSRACCYIESNPDNWLKDSENPHRQD